VADLTKNRKAYHDYHVLEKFQAGIILQGTEVKSCRAHNIQLHEAYIRIDDGEAWLINAHISLYEQGNLNNHEPLRSRKLLLNKRELRKLGDAVDQKGLALIPLNFHIGHGKIKVSVGLCRGKSKGDKRENLKERQAKREMDRAIKNQ